MPIREYKCSNDHLTEKVNFTKPEPESIECPVCKEPAPKVSISLTGTPHFSGQGWTPKRLERK